MMSDGHRPPPCRIPAGSIIRPQPVTETSLMESVAGFITEVQSYNHPQIEGKPQVTWARFETTDLNDQSIYPETMEINGNHSPLLLVLGYSHGVQIWMIPINGEAQELFALKHGQIKTLRLLRSPENVYGSPDNFAHCRPLLVTVDAAGPGPAFTAASFSSLRSGEIVHNIKFNSEIADVVANRRIVVISFREKLAAFDACNLEARFTVTTCYPSPGVHVNPIALGNRWLAYADQNLVAIHRSMGGMESDGSQSVAAWGINVGSRLAQGVSKICSTFFSSGSPSNRRHSHSSGSASGSGVGIPIAPLAGGGGSTSLIEPQKGVLTILDFVNVYRADREEVTMADRIEGVVAHFVAHNKAVVAMEFDASGSLLLTCDRLGNYFNLYKIVPHPAGSSYSAVHHLYSLYRGDTPGSVQDISFSPDSRWVAVSTLRGTTHIFPITPYGGPVGVRTHTSPRVVNRLSKFHRSAGLDECRPAIGTGGQSSSGRSSPNTTLGSSPVFSKMAVETGSPIVMVFPNPHVPPFPVPTLVQPIAQLRQPYLLTTIGAAATSAGVGRKSKHGPGGGHGGSGSAGAMEDVPIRLAVTFAPSRARLAGVQNSIFSRQHRKMNDALYVMANHGVLLEYSLDPVPDSTLNKDKICESSPIELQVLAYGQWTMVSPRDKAELQPPLMNDNPLMLSLDQLLGRGIANPRAKKDPFSALKEEPNCEEEKWLSQVEIVTHVGPHRRLWMGPQFCFKTLRSNKGTGSLCDEMEALDVDAKPESSNPMNMPPSFRHGNGPVLIEAGSASSFELSPRFANFPSTARHSGSREQVHQDVESELQEAMSETVATEDSLLDGSADSRTVATTLARTSSHRGSRSRISGRTRCCGNNPRCDASFGPEEDFFCLTPEDCQSVVSSGRSRNASGTSLSSASKQFPVQVGVPETKIFSVAVEAGSTEQPTSDDLVVCDIDTDYTGRFAVVSGCHPRKSDNAKRKKHFQVPSEEPLAAGKSRKEKKTVGSTSNPKAESKIITRNVKKNKRIGDAESTSSSNREEGISKELTTKMKTLSETQFASVESCGDDRDFLVMASPKDGDTEALLAEALMMEETDHLLGAATKEKSVLLLVDEKCETQDREEEFSSAFINAEEKFTNLDNDEPFTIREHSPSPDYDLSEGKEDKSIDESLPVIDPKAMGKPVEQSGFEGRGSDIINNIKLAEKIYDNAEGDFESLCHRNSGKSECGEESRSNRSNCDNLNISEDDMNFQPVQNRRKKKKSQMDVGNIGSSRASLADSESSLCVDETEDNAVAAPEDVATESKKSKNPDGWSFEADDLDINLLIEEVVNGPCRAVTGCSSMEEKTSLEDVFKFDSEIAAGAVCSKAAELSEPSPVIWNLNDLNDETASSGRDLIASSTDESETDNNNGRKVKLAMSTSCNVKLHHDEAKGRASESEGEEPKDKRSLSRSLLCSNSGGGVVTETTSESSVGNSPNPRKTNKKSKKSKKKRF